jgi:hypothetical protein
VAEKGSKTESGELIAAPAIERKILVVRGRRMFQLSAEEFTDLKSQSVISSGGHGGRRKRPLVFTEQGVAMLAGVLRSDRAIAVNIEIMRAFVELRRVAGSYALIEKRLEKIERGMGKHDEQLEQIFSALRHLMAPTPQPKRPVALQDPGG